MKIYAEEYNWQNDSKLVEVELFSIQGEWTWFDDWHPETGGIHFDELFTSYRAATERLLMMGYSPTVYENILFKGEWDLLFVKNTGEEIWECEIIKMEVRA